MIHDKPGHYDKCTCGHDAIEHALVVSGQRCTNTVWTVSTSGIIGLHSTEQCKCIKFVPQIQAEAEVERFNLEPGAYTLQEVLAQMSTSDFSSHDQYLREPCGTCEGRGYFETNSLSTGEPVRYTCKSCSCPGECENNSGYFRSLGMDNEEIVNDCQDPRHQYE